MKKIVFAGDFYYDYASVAEDIKEIGKWVESEEGGMILNLEGSFGLQSPIDKRGPNLHMHEAATDAMKMLNVKTVCLANNHMMDYGSEDLECTLNALNENQIMYIGAGQNLENAVKPKILKINDKIIGILNFGWNIEETVYASDFESGCAPKEKTIILSSIKKIRREVDYLIVCLHWGFEYNRLPLPCDIDLAHSIIDFGVDLIIGHHAHCVQPFEIYKGKKIYYSLGNFYFGSVRDEYNKVFKDEFIENQSDYGILVELDCNSFETAEKMVYYDKKTKQSRLVDCDACILEDISNIDYKSWAYCKKVYRRRNNINPILTNNVLLNKYKLRILFLYYKLKAIIKKVIRR